MSTAYYQYELPDGHKPKTLDEALAAKKLIGVRTFEKKKRCFTWQMQPAQFMYQALFYGRFLGVVDEHGNKQLMANWLQELQNIDIMRYNRDDLLEEEDEQPPTLAELEHMLDFQPSPPITLPPGADPHDWPTIEKELRKIGAITDQAESSSSPASSRPPGVPEGVIYHDFMPGPYPTWPAKEE